MLASQICLLSPQGSDKAGAGSATCPGPDLTGWPPDTPEPSLDLCCFISRPWPCRKVELWFTGCVICQAGLGKDLAYVDLGDLTGLG